MSPKKMWRGRGAPPAGYYAATDGTVNAYGDYARPWTLAYAFAGGPSGTTVQPGDTVWLRGGTYVRTNNYSTSGLTGTVNSPIKFQAYSGEQPIIDANFNNSVVGNHIPGLTINNAYTWIIGLCVTNSQADLYNPTAGPNPTDQRNSSILIAASNCKLINCISYATGGGFGSNYPNEYYGCINYYSGWQASDGGHGHNGYIHGDGVTLGHNIYFDPLDEGSGDHMNIQMYGSGAAEFNNASVFSELYIRGRTLFGGLNGFDVLDSTVEGCYSWDAQFDAGYYSWNLTGSIVKDSYLVASSRPAFCSPRDPPNWYGLDATGNTIIGSLDPSSGANCPSTLWPTNTYTAWASRPGTNHIVVLPNYYEANRATIIVYNWANDSSVNVDISSAVANGTNYQILNVQDFFGSPVATGTYGGGTVSIPMTGLTRQAGLSWTPPAVWSPAFGAFIVRAQGA